LGRTLAEVEAIVSEVKVLQAQGMTKSTEAEAMAAAKPLGPRGRPPKNEKEKSANGTLNRGTNSTK
jgi:hypothetical protein